MTDFLLESGRRTARPYLVQTMMSGTNAKYEADIAIMNELVEQSMSIIYVGTGGETLITPLQSQFWKIIRNTHLLSLILFRSC